MDKPASFRLKADVLKPLAARSDWPGAVQALGHLGAIALAGTWVWHTLGTWWAVPATVLLGYLLAFLFNPLHESAHQTPFRTRSLNYLLGHLAGFVILMPYEYYRAFHWDHHRYTQDVERDPELAAPLPSTSLGLAWYWSGLPTWYGRIKLLCKHGLQGNADAPWVAENKRALIVREARFYLLGYAVVIAASLATRSLAAVWLWVVPVMIGQWFIRPYLLAEHTGCANSSNMLENTRTTHTNAFVRFFAWNMPYHVEHHAYPAVPFHSLPKLHALLAEHIANSEHGYPASTASVMRHLREQRRSQASTTSRTTP
jgi:fatty acid desaturase